MLNSNFLNFQLGWSGDLNDFSWYIKQMCVMLRYIKIPDIKVYILGYSHFLIWWKLPSQSSVKIFSFLFFEFPSITGERETSRFFLSALLSRYTWYDTVKYAWHHGLHFVYLYIFDRMKIAVAIFFSVSWKKSWKKSWNDALTSGWNLKKLEFFQLYRRVFPTFRRVIT